MIIHLNNNVLYACTSWIRSPLNKNGIKILRYCLKSKWMENSSELNFNMYSEIFLVVQMFILSSFKYWNHLNKSVEPKNPIKWSDAAEFNWLIFYRFTYLPVNQYFFFSLTTFLYNKISQRFLENVYFSHNCPRQVFQFDGQVLPSCDSTIPKALLLTASSLKKGTEHGGDMSAS